MLANDERTPMIYQLLSFIEKTDRKYGAWMSYVALALMLTSASWFWLGDIPGYVRVLSKRMMHLSMALCCLRIGMLSWKSPRYVWMSAVIISLVFISSRLAQSTMLIKTVLIVAASRDTDIKVILRIYLVIFLTMLFLGPMTYLMEWTVDIVKHKYNHVGHSYGFYNPNRYAYLIQMLVLLVLHMLDVRSILWVWIVSWVSAFVVGWLTLSTTSVFVLLLLPFIYLLTRHYVIPLRFLAFFPLILTLLSVVLSFYFGPSTGSTTFESRFSIPYLVFERYGLSWLGQDCGIITWTKAFRDGIEPLYINNLYLNLFVRHGVVIGLMMLAFYGYYIFHMGRMRHPLLLSMALCLSVLGLMQVFPLSIMLDFLLMYFFQETFLRKNVVTVADEHKK